MNIPLRTAHELRQRSADSIVLEESSATRKAFEYRFGSVPVVIAAHNEEEDLPATLMSLSLSTSPVYPIVVSNGSRDRTADMSSEMGARTIELNDAAKMGALQAGTKEASWEHGHDIVLYTDGDTILSSTWASNMADIVRGYDRSTPVIAGSNVLRWHGGSVAGDSAKALWAVVNDVRRRAGYRETMVEGPSMAMKFSDSSYNDFMDIDPRLFYYEEQYVLELVRSLGGVALRTGKEVVVSRGDRTESLRDYVKQRGDTGMKVSKYRASYGYDFVPYDHTQGFKRQHQMSETQI